MNPSRESLALVLPRVGPAGLTPSVNTEKPRKFDQGPVRGAPRYDMSVASRRRWKIRWRSLLR
jgi:hypothetical protein